MNKKFTLALFMLPLAALSTLSLSAQHSLKFDSAHLDHVTTADAHPIPQIGQTDVTIELWVYVPVVKADPQVFISQGGANGIGVDDFFIGCEGPTNNLVVGPTWLAPQVTLPVGQWNHIALVVDQTNNITAWLYLNGVAVDSTSRLGESYFTTLGGGAQFQLGTNTDSSLYFSGMIDGVRIWNVQRTAADIKAGMYGPVDPNDPNLIAWYKMDEGTGAASLNSANIATTSGIDLVFQNSVNWASGPAIANNNALLFDQTVTTRVDIPSKPEYDNFASGTIEAWVKPGSLSQPASIITNGDGSTPVDTRFSLYLSNANGDKLVGLFNGTDSASITYAPGFTADNWYHVAFVTAPAAVGDTTGVFITGTYIGRLDHGYGAAIGKPLTIGGSGIDPNKYWTGSIDEVRIWNTALTPPQIQTNLATSLTGGEPNLVSVWSFDQGIPNGDNTGLKVAVDNAPLTNNGVLNNGFSLMSSATNFTTYVPVPLPVTFGKFTVTKQGTSALLKWQTYQESNTKDFIIERSGNGATYTDIGSTAAAGTSNTVKTYAFTDNDPLEGNNYYRILERDLDLKPSYSEVRGLAFTRAGNLIWYATGAKSVEVRLQKGSTELYTVSDVAGHVIRKGRLSNGTTTLTGMSGGIYFVKVINAAGNELNTKVLLP